MKEVDIMALVTIKQLKDEVKKLQAKKQKILEIFWNTI